MVFQLLDVARGLVPDGDGSSGVFPCSTKLIGERFGETFRATASGFLASSMAFGIALAPLLTTQLLGAGMTWQTVFACFMLPGWYGREFFSLQPQRNLTQANRLRATLSLTALQTHSMDGVSTKCADVVALRTTVLSSRSDDVLPDMVSNLLARNTRRGSNRVRKARVCWCGALC